MTAADVQHSTGTSGHVWAAWLPPQTPHTSLIYCLNLQTEWAAYICTVAEQQWHRRNTAVFARAAEVTVMLSSVLDKIRWRAG